MTFTQWSEPQRDSQEMYKLLKRLIFVETLPSLTAGDRNGTE